MQITIGLLILLVAGFFQGSFVLPTTKTREWKWENTWFSFSLLGMVLLNLGLAYLFIPNLFSVYAAVPTNELLVLVVFGMCWGIGAVLFGIAMDQLGMAFGYPVIMGLIASFGAVIPLFIFHLNEVLSLKGMMIMVGAIIVVGGIIICSRAHVLKTAVTNEAATIQNKSAILIAVAAGILSCLPNIGFSFSGNLINAAVNQGASSFMAGNAVWALFFTMGFIPNALYTIYLFKKNKSVVLFKKYSLRNGFAGFLMALMWIGSFYLYGISNIRLGNWGAIIGWPLFIALSIITGNIWGLANGEWKNAPATAQLTLRKGIGVIFIAVIWMGICNFL